ncbi:MAG TPA: enoyl-CoA hydratase-related protein [Microbacteriaceae bacterium]|nr:enoyl-CoA hydratase-related protein [Microbacteriaceae bacterium]
MPETPAILVETVGTTRHLRLNRPDKRNAVSSGMYVTLESELRVADIDDSVTSVIISGEGSDFTAGNDLADFLDDPPLGPDAPVLRFLAALTEVGVPLIAAVHGHAVGIGATMLLHCDFAVADRTAVLSFPFVRLGVVPEAASSLLLPRAVGPKLAASLLLTGEPLAAAAALEVGLLTSVVQPGHAPAAAMAIAERLAALPREAVRATRRLLHAPEETTRERLDREAVVFAERLRSPEFRTLAAKVLGQD